MTLVDNTVAIENSVIEEAHVYDELVTAYQKDPNPVTFGDLYESVRTYLNRLAKQQHKKVVGYGVDLDTVKQEVDIALWKASENFDGSQGSNFISWLKQNVAWRVSDYIIRPMNSEKNKANADNLSLDVQDVYGDTILDSMDYVEQGLGGSTLEDNALFMEVRELIEQFKAYGTEADYRIVSIVFSILLEKGNADNDTVNDALYMEYPKLKKPSVRSKKTRALQKFKEFCELDGTTVNIEEIL